MKMSRFACLILTVLGITACTPQHVFSEYRDIPGLKWSSTDTLTYAFEIKDPGTYAVAISARHRKDYEFSNLWLRVQLNGPQTDTAFRFEMVLFNAEGRPFGETSGSMCTQTIPLKGVSRLPKGQYTIRLVQLMRKDPIDGIQDVGVLVDKK